MDEQITPAPLASNPPQPRRRRRILLLVSVTVALALVLIVALAGLSALAVRGHLQDGRGAMNDGRSALLAGSASTALGDFSRAEAAFRSAADEARSPWMSITGMIPILGRTPRAVRAIADGGLDVAEAAAGVARAVVDLPGGLGALSPTAAGGIPTDRLGGIAGALALGDRLTGRAVASLEAAPDGLILPSVASALDAARTQIEGIHRELDAASRIVQRLPAFLGADGPRHYFVGASTPAELRGTGGVIGAYAILTIDHGHLILSHFRPTHSLPRPDVQQVPSPSAEYSTNYDFFRNGVGFWLNANMTPDFPLAAKAIWLGYRQAKGETLDGIIVADPFALQALMRVTGPVRMAKTGIKVSKHNVVAFMTNQAYALFKTHAERQLVLGRVAVSVLRSFLDAKGDPLGQLRALISAFKDGHVKVWTSDPALEEGLALTSAGGAFRPSGTDLVSVITNSFSGTKLDFWQRRTIVDDVQLGPAGAASASLVVELANGAPTSGYPRYVIGPFQHFSTQPGQNVTLVHLYCGIGCQLQGASEGGKPIQLGRFQELGYPFYEDYVRTNAGDTARIAANLLLPHAWTGSDTGGTYQLSFIGQTTIPPITLRVVIHAPKGMRFTSASGQLRRDGQLLVYEGHPTGNLDLAASFAPSLPIRIWRDLLHALP
jgi:hypothetical protein